MKTPQIIEILHSLGIHDGEFRGIEGITFHSDRQLSAFYAAVWAKAEQAESNRISEEAKHIIQRAERRGAVKALKDSTFKESADWVKAQRDGDYPIYTQQDMDEVLAVIKLVHDNTTQHDWPDDIWAAIEGALK